MTLERKKFTKKLTTRVRLDLPTSMDRCADTYVAKYACKIRHHSKDGHDFDKSMLPESHPVQING